MPKTCPQCQNVAADDAAACPSCGASLSAGATATQVAPPAVSAPAPATAPPAAASAPAGAAAASTGSSIPAYKFDAARWSRADRIIGIATIVLFISLFLSWFSYNLGIGIYHWDALSAHGYLWIVAILSILIIAYLALRAGLGQATDRREHPAHHSLDGGDHRESRARPHRLHLQARGIRRLGSGLVLRCVRGPHRGHSGRGAASCPAAAGEDDWLTRQSGSSRQRRTAASSNPGILAADGSASNATNWRMTS